MTESEGLWQDRDIRFDISNQDLQYGAGEEQIDRLPNVEDTKGNSGDKGTLYVTNLRIIWQSLARPRVNLSVGFNCVTGISTRTVNSKLCGIAEALYIMTKSNSTRYEFIFTNMTMEQPRLIASVLNTFKAYSATKLYRDLHLRAALLHNRQLRLLPMEQLCSQVNGVWNLSSDQGNLGTMHITNVRIVWHANMNESFNISLPYLQVAAIKTRESKFGTALVIETTDRVSALRCRRAESPQKEPAIGQALLGLLKVHKTKPIMGVDVFMQKQVYEEATTQDTGPEIQDEPEVNSADGTHYDAFAKSVWLGMKLGDDLDSNQKFLRNPTFRNRLGSSLRGDCGGYIAATSSKHSRGG
ncbi:hypothetical protein HPB51_002852 [Rhipicephalus microplus]|uniref:BBSome complex member BBS5 PH domain-containing protein n=1 Tax=Rhipicephalus microplus TaxID=6941 RepID=A0A9J6EWV7_RHIMP|nr:hypothetical protein HPB51_002852 [Rhipicephalus microplus]